MSSDDNLVSIDRMDNILRSIRTKGVRLWLENGHVHYSAPKGALTQEEIARLRASREQIAALLSTSEIDRRESRVRSSSKYGRVPLAFSQLAHWNLYRLSERRALRQIASATRLRGPLHVDTLKEGLAEIIRRHDALRTRILVLEGVPSQEFAEGVDCELGFDDLTSLETRARETEVRRSIDHLILDPICVTTGPLLGARLLRVDRDEHVLIIAMEHLISDMFSMGILLRDLLTAYAQLSHGRTVNLPAIPVQFSDYSISQREHQKAWIEKHSAYWDGLLAQCHRLRFPADQSIQTETLVGWGTVPIQIGNTLKKELVEWSRWRRTTLVMSVFTAYIAVVLRWCNESKGVFQFQSDGRISLEVENTIGYFASPLYLRIELQEHDSYVDLLSQVTTEYCNAYSNADFSYLAARFPRPEISGNTVFNWVPQGLNSAGFDLDTNECAITGSPVHFENPWLKALEWDLEPSVLFLEADDGIVGGVHFPLNRFLLTEMERFSRNFLRFVVKLLQDPQCCVKDISLV